jgi:hypothetical protein
VERTANSLHATTKSHVVRRGLLFKKGDRLISSEISDNERILRETPNLLDARIYVLPRRRDADTVDILVVTQDVLSTSGGASGDTRSASIDLNENNFLGLGHEVRTRTTYRSQLKPRSEDRIGWGFRGLYRVPYIATRSLPASSTLSTNGTTNGKACCCAANSFRPKSNTPGDWN